MPHRWGMNRRVLHITAIVVATLLITGLHLFLMLQSSHSIVFEELYYIPLLLGALRFDFKGAFFTYLLVSIAYVPFFFGAWSATPAQLIDRVIHLVFSGFFVIIAYKFAERERERHRQAEQERYFTGIGQAATVIVHDLKNPLVSVQGYARRIQEGKGDAVAAAGVIAASAQTMQRIVSDVLEFSKPLQLDRTSDDLCPAVRRAIEVCKAKAGKKKVDIAANLPSEPLICVFDRFLLERALVNLIDNAVDASPAGQTVLVVSSGSGNSLVISITDHGPGMDEVTLGQLCTLSFTTKDEGTGFGVPISKKIIEAHGGMFQITSALNRGTEVKITLPRTLTGFRDDNLPQPQADRGFF